MRGFTCDGACGLFFASSGDTPVRPAGEFTYTPYVPGENGERGSFGKPVTGTMCDDCARNLASTLGLLPEPVSASLDDEAAA